MQTIWNSHITMQESKSFIGATYNQWKGPQTMLSLDSDPMVLGLRAYSSEDQTWGLTHARQMLYQ